MMFLKAFVMSKVYKGELKDVYAQDYRLWEPYKDHIRTFFRQGMPKSVNRVAVHIRRGDYLKAQEFHTNLWNTEYYYKAIKEVPRRKYLVFCMDRQNPDQDEKDRDWCKKNLPNLLGEFGTEWELAPIHDQETDDMNLMASCDYIIGANSSFSWWASFLSDAERVVFPAEANCFVDGKIRMKLLPEWTQIPV